MLKTLPGEQVGKLERAFKKSKKKHEALRMQAMLLLTQGYSREEAAGIVKVSIHCIDNWILRFKRNGIEGLFDKPQPGNHRKLTIKQKEELKQVITTNTPEQRNLEGKFWSPYLVSQLIKNQYNISYHSEPSRRLLHSFGFTFHKPEKVNKKQKTGDKVRFEEKLKKDLETGEIDVIRWYW